MDTPFIKLMKLCSQTVPVVYTEVQYCVNAGGIAYHPVYDGTLKFIDKISMHAYEVLYTSAKFIVS